MTLAIPQIILGAQVALTHAEDGETRLPVERRGVIVAVDTAKKIGKNDSGKTVILATTRNGNPACGVDKIWVRFKKGQEPVAVKNCQLTLIHEANRKTYDEIKREDKVKEAAALEKRNAEASKLEAMPDADDQIPVVVPDEPIVVQELGVNEGSGLTTEQIRALEAGEPVEPEETPTVLKRWNASKPE
jgi:hypothetical protein